MVESEGYHFVEQLIRHEDGTETIRFGPPGSAPAATLGARLADIPFHPRLQPPVAHVHLAEQSRDPLNDVQAFIPLSTSQRWMHESRITQGKFTNERLARLTNHVIVALLPAAREAALEAKVRAEKEAAEREEEARKEESRKEELRKEEEAREELRRQAEAEAPRALDPQEPEGTNTAPLTTDVEMVDSRPEDASVSADTEMADSPALAVSVSDPLAPQPPEPSSEPSASTSSARVTVLVHGNPVDITDTGIDPTFLEALPDDMREEVLNQHFREQRNTTQAERIPESQISPEFLDALPPDIREEILQQESLEQSRREAAARSNAAPAGPSDIDPASFIASLDPQLRHTVLLEQEESFLRSLPSAMIAEATLFRTAAHRRYPPGRRAGAAPGSAAPAPSSTVLKSVAHRDAIQLLDKSGIATLIRLLFFPQVLRKNMLYKVLVNLCENSKTRTELFNLLLGILQDGTGDLSSVDKSFSQMSFRNSKSQTTPRPASKHKGLDAPSTSNVPTLAPLSTDDIPNLVAQRCLEALTYIVSANSMYSLFFLTEQELPTGLKRFASKKGKGKEKQAPQSHYPIVLLLSLLDQATLLKTTAMMDSIASLLAIITRPLTSLKESPKAAAEVDKPAAQPPAVAPAPIEPTPTQPPAPGKTF